ncbi:MAG: alpha-amylase [Polyangiaceae bacterium]|nr:alpha-amylase [Polyangiaceae bacterium]
MTVACLGIAACNLGTFGMSAGHQGGTNSDGATTETSEEITDTAPHTDTATTGATTQTSGGTASASDSATDTNADTDTDGETIDLDAPKLRIYQLSVRLFSNTKTINIQDGDLMTNGVGKFDDIDEVALDAIRKTGFSHIWLHGVIQQASANAYDVYMEPPSDPDILQGKAGPFDAITDYYDVSPDYATNPAARLDEFQALAQRAHDAGLKVLIDFIPNHVSRTYQTNVPLKINLGLADSTGSFFAPNNNFYYIVDPPGQVLNLPTPDWWNAPGTKDQTTEDEDNDGMPMGDIPRVTANNAVTPSPSIDDLYYATKINYGYDFTQQKGFYDPMPKTWSDMTKILNYWQGLGVDGFRVDHANYAPVEFWQYAIDAAKTQDPEVIFVGECYASDPLAIPGSDAAGLLDAGFTAVTDNVAYDTIKKAFCCGGWANDLSAHIENIAPISDQMLRYTETHWDRRIASPLLNGDTNSGFGSAKAGKPASALLFLLSQGPIQIYNGQEVGEPGAGAEGFGREDGRTTIYDYWAMPELAKWVNDHAYDGGQLSASQKELRNFYQKLLEISTLPSFATGSFHDLQTANRDDDTYCSKGRWCYVFLRYRPDEAHLVLVNLHPNNTYKPYIHIPSDALSKLGLEGEQMLVFTDRLDAEGQAIEAPVAKLSTTGVEIPLLPSQARVFKISPGT